MCRLGWVVRREERNVKSWGWVVRPISPSKKRLGAQMGIVRCAYEGEVRGVSRWRSDRIWKRRDGDILG
jgi:hypothetical protein